MKAMKCTVFLIFMLSMGASHLQAAQTLALFKVSTDAAGQQSVNFSFPQQSGSSWRDGGLAIQAQASPPCH